MFRKTFSESHFREGFCYKLVAPKGYPFRATFWTNFLDSELIDRFGLVPPYTRARARVRARVEWAPQLFWIRIEVSENLL